MVNVSSDAHRPARVDFDDLQLERRYTAFGAYCLSKLMNLLFTFELARRIEARGITANAAHPGPVASNFGRSNKGFLGALFALAGPFMLTPEKGARTQIWLASAPELGGRDRQVLRQVPREEAVAARARRGDAEAAVGRHRRAGRARETPPKPSARRIDAWNRRSASPGSKTCRRSTPSTTTTSARHLHLAVRAVARGGAARLVRRARRLAPDHRRGRRRAARSSAGARCRSTTGARATASPSRTPSTCTRSSQRRGVGRALLADLVARARALGHHTIVASVSADQAASLGAARGRRLRRGRADAGAGREVRSCGWTASTCRSSYSGDATSSPTSSSERRRRPAPSSSRRASGP